MRATRGSRLAIHRLPLALLTCAVATSCSEPAGKSGSAQRGAIDTVQVVFGDTSPAATSAGSGSASDSAEIVDVVERYYRNLDTGNLRAAYDLLEDSPDRPSYRGFAEQHQGRSDIRVMTRRPGRIEGAAGSRYVEVPVLVSFRKADGTREKMEVSHTLRKSVVDGASATQRSWRITSSKVIPAH